MFVPSVPQPAWREESGLGLDPGPGELSNALRSQNVAPCSPAMTGDSRGLFTTRSPKEVRGRTLPSLWCLPPRLPIQLPRGQEVGRLGSGSLQARAACSGTFPSHCECSFAEEPGRAARLVNPLPPGVRSPASFLPLSPPRVGVRPKFLVTLQTKQQQQRGEKEIPLIFFFKGGYCWKIAGGIKLLLIAQLSDYLWYQK